MMYLHACMSVVQILIRLLESKRHFFYGEKKREKRSSWLGLGRSGWLGLGRSSWLGLGRSSWLARVGKIKLARVGKIKLARVGKIKLARVGMVKLARVGKVKLARVRKVKLARIGKIKLARVGMVKLARVGDRMLPWGGRGGDAPLRCRRCEWRVVTCDFQAVQRRGEAGNYLSMEGGSGPGTYLTSTESIYSAVSQHSNYPGTLGCLTYHSPGLGWIKTTVASLCVQNVWLSWNLSQ